MSVKKRCFTYCNDCHCKDSWKIVEADCQEALDFKLKRTGDYYTFLPKDNCCREKKDDKDECDEDNPDKGKYYEDHSAEYDEDDSDEDNYFNKYDPCKKKCRDPCKKYWNPCQKKCVGCEKKCVGCHQKYNLSDLE